MQNNSRQEFFILGIAVSQRAAKEGKIFPALQGRGGLGGGLPYELNRSGMLIEIFEL